MAQDDSIDVGNIFIGLDGQWEFVDLAVLPKTYSELYSVVYLLENLPSSSDEMVSYTFQAHPWEGGYSALNFYLRKLKVGFSRGISSTTQAQS